MEEYNKAAWEELIDRVEQTGVGCQRGESGVYFLAPFPAISVPIPLLWGYSFFIPADPHGSLRMRPPCHGSTSLIEP
ncbi:hypothetical protein A2U01_0046740 [Trifolium medium]|uniref:Uncharacterized protein n=1 Tax=Trifolium medium TaxID=97028 RepID=A0A392QNL7_9FABA|nr:hypothetical protein [Trifolium medium]